ncbi:oxidoreductase [Malassezia pachydermatis]
MRELLSLVWLALTPLVWAVTYDAVIVGGGLSGLSAAKELTARNKTWVVLEARDRVGGRVWNKELPDGRPVEVGAEFIGPTQDHVIALSKELGLSLYETPTDGDNIYYANNKAQRFPTLFGSLVPPVGLVDTLKLAELQGEIDDMAKKINPESPWDTPEASTWDAQSVKDWLKSKGSSQQVQDVIDTTVQEVFSTSTEKISVLYMAVYVAASGDAGHVGTFERLTQTHPGAQQYRVTGGTYRLATGLLDKLGKPNVKLSSPVDSITKGDGSNATYTVTTRDGTSYEGQHVIVAMSPPMADKIKFTPSLPNQRQQVQKLWKMGSLGKAIPQYETAFWRDDHLNGQAISTSGYTRATFDSTPENKGHGVMLCFVQDDMMRELDQVDEDTIKDKITQDLVNYFGDKAKKPMGWVIQRWDLEEFSGGGPTSNPPLHAFAQYGEALRKPVGNLHWAGTESSDYWIGYMDGALRAGQRAASEIH